MFWRFWKRGHLRYQALLSEYIDNRLSTVDQQDLEEHLGSCPKCSDDLESLRATVGLLKEVPMVKPARSFKLQAPPVREQGRPVFLWSVQASTVAAAALLVALVAGDLMGAFDNDRLLFESEISDDPQSYETVASDYQMEAAAPAPAPSQASPGMEDPGEPMQAQEFSLQATQDTGITSQKSDAALEEAESPEVAAPAEVEDLGEPVPTETDDGDSVIRKIEIALGSALGVLVLATGYLTYRRRKRV